MLVLAYAQLQKRLEENDAAAAADLEDIEMELDLCNRTNNRYTDCSRINKGVPQRFLTKYLRVRLKDHYEHEKVRTYTPT
jgi:hypothetical protein